MNCWGRKSLSLIASAVGIPIYADECTTKQTRVSFARMLVKVNVTKPLPTEVAVIDPSGRTFQQVVQYDWKPKFCDNFQNIGHNCAGQKKDEQRARYEQRKNSPKKMVQKWQYKGPLKKANNLLHSQQGNGQADNQ